MARKEQIEFVRKIYPAAARLYRSGGVHPLFVTAQAALETGWKIKGIGNNIFGITKGSKWTGSVSLELTTEYFKTPSVKFKAPERVVSNTSDRANTNTGSIGISGISRRWMNASTTTWNCFANRDMPMRGPTGTTRKSLPGGWWTTPGRSTLRHRTTPK